MKKLLLLVFVMSFCFGFFLYERPEPKPDYCIWSSFSNNSSDYRSTDLHILLYSDISIVDDLYEEIRKNHNNMNGNPDRLIIHVYSNIDDLQKGNEVGEKEFNVKE